ncbi:MAG: hypothetical protein A3H42_03915 [Deltaproteobacteria bacterium RIFCSPLOWO2_02_FULL_46_8]|nr:MAG: hypothetical protein A3H42_03915 [Deltaproteobacteria bacterium RIFCSPLOWO2_02_FULL_46_8]
MIVSVEKRAGSDFYLPHSPTLEQRHWRPMCRELCERPPTRGEGDFLFLDDFSDRHELLNLFKLKHWDGWQEKVCQPDLSGGRASLLLTGPITWLTVSRETVKIF